MKGAGDPLLSVSAHPPDPSSLGPSSSISLAILFKKLTAGFVNQRSPLLWNQLRWPPISVAHSTTLGFALISS